MDHLTKEQIERYQAGSFAQVQDYREADAHIATCDYCRSRMCGSAEGTVTAKTLSMLLEGPTKSYRHPSQEVLVDYVGREVNTPTVAISHIRDCDLCQENVADLRGYLRGLEEARPPIAETDRAKRSPSPFGVFRARFLYGGAFAAAAMAILFVLVMSRPVVAINDAGGQWTLDRWGRLAGPVTLPPALQAAQTRALRDSELNTPAILASLKGHSDTLLRPSGTVVLSGRPTLAWRPPSDATAETEYVCTIVSTSNPKFKRPPSKPIKKPFWTLPSAKPPLPRGEIYTWKVIARTKGKTTELTGAVAALPKFKVLSQSDADTLDQASRTVAGSHLTLGLLYVQNGILDRAEQEFETLLRSNPNSEIIKLLLSRLRALDRPAN